MVSEPAPAETISTVPHEVCGYVVDGALPGGKSLLAIGPGGRGVVLKKLDEDCMLRGLLHPSIRERLSRVRELAHGGVANLQGVGRDGEQAYLIWEYVPGVTFEDYVSAKDRTPRDLLLMARELVLSVDALHAQGIVHGALTGGNVIVAADGSVRLTHISPLLYSDPGEDVGCVLGLVKKALEQQSEQGLPLGLFPEQGQPQTSLRVFAAKLAGLLESRDESPPLIATEERRLRRRTLLAAFFVTAAALIAGLAIWHMVKGGPDLHGALRWISGPNDPP